MDANYRNIEKIREIMGRLATRHDAETMVSLLASEGITTIDELSEREWHYYCSEVRYMVTLERDQWHDYIDRY